MGKLIGEQNNFKIECLSTLTPTILSNQDFEDWYMVNRGEWVLRGVCCFLCYMLWFRMSLSPFFKRWKTSDDLSRTNCILFNTNVFCCVLLASWIMLMMGRSKWYCILILFHLFLQMKTLTIIVLLGVLLMFCHGSPWVTEPIDFHHVSEEEAALARQRAERTRIAFARLRNRTRQASGRSDILILRQRLSDRNAV